jgi:hypothetical protein
MGLHLREINRYSWDVIGLSETHCPISGKKKHGDAILFSLDAIMENIGREVDFYCPERLEDLWLLQLFSPNDLL